MGFKNLVSAARSFGLDSWFYLKSPLYFLQMIQTVCCLNSSIRKQGQLIMTSWVFMKIKLINTHKAV